MGHCEAGNMAAGSHTDPRRTHHAVSRTSPSAPPHLETAFTCTPSCGSPDRQSSQFIISLQQQLHHSTGNNWHKLLHKAQSAGRDRKSPALLLTGRSPGGPDWLVRSEWQEHCPQGYSVLKDIVQWFLAIPSTPVTGLF